MRLNSINVRVENDDVVDFTNWGEDNELNKYSLHVGTDLAIFATEETWKRIVKEIRDALPDDLPLEAES